MLNYKKNNQFIAKESGQPFVAANRTYGGVEKKANKKDYMYMSRLGNPKRSYKQVSIKW